MTLLLVILVISLLILVHEWGHFYSARRLGVKVEEFGFGFPPRLISRVKGGVRYSLNLLPFGGFVKIFGEQGEGETDQDSFASRPAWQRFIILAAGVFMNFLLAWFVFTLGASIGVPQMGGEKDDGVPVSIIAVASASPAERSGLKFGDQILEMRAPGISLRIESEDDIRNFVDAYRGEDIKIILRRGGALQEITVVPRVDFPEGEGPLGVALARIVVRSVPWYLAPLEGAKTLTRSVVATTEGLLIVFRDLFTEGKVPDEISGPIGIFFFADDTRSLGLSYFIQFVGILSVNLAVLNFLPIPALDGGRIFFLIIEKIKGSRVSLKFESTAHTMGFVLLIILMVLVTYHDVMRII